MSERTLPTVLGDSLARGLSKQINRERFDQIVARLKRKRFSPPSRRFGAVKRARLKWAQDIGGIFIDKTESKRMLSTAWLLPNSDGSWSALEDTITPEGIQEPRYIADAITAHAAQRLLQAKVPIQIAARVLGRVVCSTLNRSGCCEYATTEGLWRFDKFRLVTFIPATTLDPHVRRRWEALLNDKGEQR